MTDALRDLLRTAAPQLIATAVEAELASDLSQFTDVRTGRVMRLSGAMGTLRPDHSKPALVF